MDIGKAIKRAREKAELSQPALSDRCGWGYQQARISHYETGRRRPSLEDLEVIAQALNMTLVELLLSEQESYAEPMTTADRRKRAEDWAKAIMSLPPRRAALLVDLLRELQRSS